MGIGHLITPDEERTVTVILIALMNGYDSLDSEADEIMADFNLKQSTISKLLEQMELMACLKRMVHAEYHPIIDRVMIEGKYRTF
jgi:hypothetical protein